jgi:hypothetical protein
MKLGTQLFDQMNIRAGFDKYNSKKTNVDLVESSYRTSEWQTKS